MKKIKRISIIVLTVVFMLMNASLAFAADASAYSQIDASAIPYKVSPNTYLISQNGVLTWKKYNTILGYNDMGTVKNSEAITEVYENRQGDTVEGSLNYSWTFDGNVLQPILESKKGPIGLGITLTQTESGLSVAFATTRVFDGTVTIKLNVGNYYKDGDKLSLTYVDGVDASQIHGSDTSVISTASAAEEGLLVQEGFATFTISNGGNYTLVKAVKEETSSTQNSTTDNSAADTSTTDASTTDTSAIDTTAGTIDGIANATDSEGTTASPKTASTSDIVVSNNTQTDEDAATEAPTTGSDQNIILYGAVILLTGIGVLVLRRKSDLQ